MHSNWSSIVKPSGKPITSDQLQQFETDLTFPLPEEYRAFLLTLNGGKALVDHEIHLPKLSCDVFVNYLSPLTAESPSLGIKEGRDIQVRHRQGLRQAVVIGDNMGTGFFS